MKLKFTRQRAAHAFASMAEGMEGVGREDKKYWDADQLHLVARTIRNNLQELDGVYFVVLPNASRETVAAIKENCECHEANECYADDCEIDEFDDEP